MSAQPDFGPKPELRWIPVARLTVDLAYQRSLETRRSQQLIAAIAGGFRWSKFGAVLVAPIESGGAGRGRPREANADLRRRANPAPGAALEHGSYALLDGQHRVAGARQLGIKEVPCIVIEAASTEEQAQAFVGANRDRVAVTPYALHHAMVAAGDPRARAVARVCQAAEVEIPRYPIPVANLKPNQTLALGTIAKAVGPLIGGSDTTDEASVVIALRILRQRFADVAGALRAHLIQGLVGFLRTHPAAPAEPVLAALQRFDLVELEHRIQQRMQRAPGTRAIAFAALIEEWTRPARTAPAAMPERAPSSAEIAAAHGATLQGALRLSRPKPFDPRALNGAGR